MCGLFGFIPNGSKPDMEIVSAIAKQASCRGTQAFGLSQVDPTTGLLDVYKRPGDVSDHLEKLSWVKGSSAFIGHTRYSTSGHWSDNRNNQPIVFSGGMFSVAHNGMLSSKFYERMRESLKLKTECDSEVIGAIMEKSFNDHTGEAFAALLKESADMLEDVFEVKYASKTSKSNRVVHSEVMASTPAYAVMSMTKDTLSVAVNWGPLEYLEYEGGIYFVSVSPAEKKWGEWNVFPDGSKWHGRFTEGRKSLPARPPDATEEEIDKLVNPPKVYTPSSYTPSGACGRGSRSPLPYDEYREDHNTMARCGFHPRGGWDISDAYVWCGLSLDSIVEYEIDGMYEYQKKYYRPILRGYIKREIAFLFDEAGLAVPDDLDEWEPPEEAPTALYTLLTFCG